MKIEYTSIKENFQEIYFSENNKIEITQFIVF